MIHFAKIKNARERMLRPICDFDLQTIFFSPPAAAKLIRHLTWLRKPARKPIPWWWLGIPNQSSKKYGWTCAGCRPGRTRSHGWDPSHELSLAKSVEAAVSFAPSIVTILFWKNYPPVIRRSTLTAGLPIWLSTILPRCCRPIHTLKSQRRKRSRVTFNTSRDDACCLVIMTEC